MPLNYGAGEDSWESLGLQRDQTSLSWGKSVLNIHWKDWCWSWSSNTLATWCKDLTHWKRPWCWERLRSGGKGDGRGWDDWMASPTQRTWVWANSGRWWRIVKPGVLQSMGSQRVRHDWATEQWCFHFCGRCRMVIPCLMRITSSLGKTPKIHRWVLSNPPFWPQRTVLLEYQLTQTEPFMVPSRTFWSPCEERATILPWWPTSEESGREGRSHWKEWKPQRNSEKNSEHTGHAQDLVSLPRAPEAQIHLFSSGEPLSVPPNSSWLSVTCHQ